MKKLFALLLLSVPCLSAGPKYVGPTSDPLVYQEFQNAYHDIANPVANTITLKGVALSTFTATTATYPTNILDNGGFESYGWQRGTSFTAPANGAYIADRWKVSTSEPANVTVTKETTNIDSGLSSIKVVVTSAGASQYWAILQNIDNFADYRGKVLTLSARIKSSIATSHTITISDSGGNATSAYHSGGGGWETLTVSRTIDSAATFLTIYIGDAITVGTKKNGTYYFDSAMLSIGSEAVTFVPTNPQVDLARCQRFFQVIGGAANYVGMGQCLTTTGGQWIYPLKVTMRAAPTAVINNPTSFSASNSSGGAPSLTTLSMGDASATEARFLFAISAASLVAGNASNMSVSNANGTIFLSADL